MKPTLWQMALCAAGVAAAVASPAMASTVTMEDVAPGTFYLPDGTFSRGGATFTVNFGTGVIDTVAAFGAGVGLDAAPPKGNDSQFFIGLNDASVTLTSSNDRVLRVMGFDFGFVAALTALFAPGEEAGAMVASYVDLAGVAGAEVWSFGAADARGQFSFLSTSGTGALAAGVRSVEFFACTANAAGQCVRSNGNFSQFAIDNIDIPEPGSLALAALALGIAGGVRARRAR
jgi:PEP-CTERM motif